MSGSCADSGSCSVDLDTSGDVRQVRHLMYDAKRTDLPMSGRRFPGRSALPGCGDSFPRCRNDLGVVGREDFIDHWLERRAKAVKDPPLGRVFKVDRLVVLLIPTCQEIGEHECVIVGEPDEYLVRGRPRRSL